MDNGELTYPEHEKLAAVKERSQEIGTFLDWLNGEKQIVMCKWHESHSETHSVPKSAFAPDGRITYTDPAGYGPANENTEKLLAQYFGIDLDVLEKEKRAMLAVARKSARDS